VSERGLQLPVQLQRQVHVHRTLLDHLSKTHIHTDTQGSVHRARSDTDTAPTRLPSPDTICTPECPMFACVLSASFVSRSKWEYEIVSVWVCY
jgi:hypothetical protein